MSLRVNPTKSRPYISKLQIAKFVQEVNNDPLSETSNEIAKGVRRVLDKTENKITRVLWFLIVIGNLFVCSYQISTQIRTYFAWPLSVDVHNSEIVYGRLPNIIMIPRITEKLRQYKLRVLAKHPHSNLLKPHSCLVPFTSFDDLDEKQEFASIWELLDGKEIFNQIQLYTHGRKSKESTRLAFSSEPMLHGNGFQISFEEDVQFNDPNFKIELKTDYVNRSLPYSCFENYNLYLMPFNQRRITSPFLGLFCNMNNYLWISFTKYTNVNSPTKRCLSNDDYYKCCADTFDDYTKRQFSCSSSDAPSCVLTKELSDQLLDVLAYFNKFQMFDNFTCLRPCEGTVIHMSPEYYNDPINMTTIFIGSNVIREVTERYSYEFVSLLCDIGGNVGLYTGLSVISLVELISILRTERKRRRATSNNLNDPLKAKVAKMFTEVNSNVEQNRSEELSIRDFSGGLKKLTKQKTKLYWLILICSCSCVCVYQIYDRINYFCSYPVYVTVTVVADRMIEYPSLIFCRHHFRLDKLKRLLLKKRGLPNKCGNIDFLNILDFTEKNITADKLWQLSDITHELHDIARDFTDNILARDFKYLNITSVATIFGTCGKVTKDIEEYEAMYSNFFVSTFQGFNKQCHCEYKLFYQNPNEIFVVNHYLAVECGTDSNLRFSRQTIKLLNTPMKPCALTEIANECAKNCAHTRAMQNVSCRLPFMDKDAENLSSCTTYETAENTRNAFLRAYASLDPSKECGCIKRCSQTLYYPNEYLWNMGNFDYTNVRASFESNYREIIAEERSFTVIKLFCDIGSILGCMLGMSVMSVFELFESLFRKFRIRVVNE